MDSVRMLKANLKVHGKPCGWCQEALQLGDDAAICTACDAQHHQRCWEGKAGCSTTGCASAPLPQLDVAAVAGATGVAGAAPLPPDKMRCPACRSVIPAGDHICLVCRAITSPDGIYHGPKVNAPGAVSSLVFGLVGLFFCGIILGPVAISKSGSAKRAMAEDPTLGGQGLATAGQVLGILDIVFFVILFLVKMAGMEGRQ